MDADYIEVWKVLDFIGFDNYAISNWGRCKSLNFHRTGCEQILKPYKNKKGYLRVNLWKNGKCKKFQVHRLVALAFLPNSDNLPQVNHKDENPSNNRLDNLEFCDCKYNINYGTGLERRVKALTGIKRSEEFKAKISEAMTGKRHSDETKRKISKANKGKKLSEETINKLSESHSKPVAQYTLDETLIAVYSSTAEAGRQGYDQPNVSSCCNGKRKTCGGYKWKYING